MRVLVLLIAGIVAIAGGAIVLRDVVGLRLAPIRVPHPSIEYLYAPNQRSKRAGLEMRVNEYGMRSDSFPRTRETASELRIMVFGDSILAAPGLTGHDQLATTLAQQTLAAQLGRRVIVGNVAAGSWGPGNWLAYANAFGFFDADVVVLVASGHDHPDVPEFAPMHPNPTPIPQVLVPVAELASRLRLQVLASADSGGAGQDTRPDPRIVENALNDLAAFLELARSRTPQVRVLLLPEMAELSGAAHTGRAEIEALARGLGLPVRRPDDRYRQKMLEGRELYLDNIHPNDAGQALLAELLVEEAQLALAFGRDP